MTKLIHILALVVSLAAAATADARPFSYVENDMVVYAAPSYFQRTAPCTTADARIESDETVARYAGDPFVEGLAAIWAYPAPYQAYKHCAMMIAESVTDESYVYGCVLVLHEYGHWLGLGHSTVPGNLMNASDPGTPPQCITRRDAIRNSCRATYSSWSRRDDCYERWRVY